MQARSFRERGRQFASVFSSELRAEKTSGIQSGRSYLAVACQKRTFIVFLHNGRSEHSCSLSRGFFCRFQGGFSEQNNNANCWVAYTASISADVLAMLFGNVPANLQN
jgi:hypothetical protein